ncbi:MAG: addiction module antidote protein, HigA family [Deltaproteobacteria bacterium RIFOXYD12_FULL_57_12]|nr:MAG: addiction module antidote protein, HigA family [Deltaproteobacteria bacterium RIFOXYD12_FULL_57_12]
MVRVPTDSDPTHPGEMLREEFLLPMGITQQQLADGIHVPFQRINELVNGKRGVTPSTSLRLAKFFGVSEDFWIILQIRWDLYRTKKKEREILEKIKPVKMEPTGKQS